ncbi:zeta toxin family protein [Candidatus Uhrbacteria bacterium]|nr:zeta toxin family protein [Candidatus Uhrbacteria bacterium]
MCRSSDVYCRCSACFAVHGRIAGAGKTEISKRLTKRFQVKPVRIDADDIREFVP